MQLALLEPQPPPPVPRVNLILGDALEACAEARDEGGADLVWLDPPWHYDSGSAGKGWKGTAGGVYDTSPDDAIAFLLSAAWEAATPDAYAVCWATWPKLAEIILMLSLDTPWCVKTGGSWHKTGGLGVGTHIRGDSEPLLILTKGNPRPQGRSQSNAWASPRQQHSRKPSQVARDLVPHYCPPGGRILVPFAGLDPVLRIGAELGRSVVAAELDPARHRHALTLLATGR